MASLQRYKLTKANIESLSGSKRERADALYEKLCFMEVELRKLQKTLRKKGWVEEYQNGANQSGLKKSSEADVYNTLVKNYSSIMKQLEEMLPPDQAKSKLDTFLSNEQ